MNQPTNSISIRPTSRYGQLHVVWVSLQTLDNHIQETHFVEHRQRLAAALTEKDNTIGETDVSNICNTSNKRPQTDIMFAWIITDNGSNRRGGLVTIRWTESAIFWTG